MLAAGAVERGFVLKVVSYYTNAYYCKLAMRLADSLNRHGMTYEIQKIEAKDWREAVSKKPGFILDALRASSCSFLLWIDADGVCERPILETEFSDCDLGFVKWQRSPHHEKDHLTGTMLFRNTPEVQGFIDEWDYETGKYCKANTPEQHGLKSALDLMEHWPVAERLRVKYLPPEYCFIFDDMREMYPDAKAAVTHYQASREYKELEKRGIAQEEPKKEEVLPVRLVADPSEWGRSRGKRN